MTPPNDIASLQKENAFLKSELHRLKTQQEKSTERKRAAIKAGGRFLLPLMDRRRVVRSFIELVETAATYTGPRNEWAPREDLVGAAKQFSLAFMRFVVRRRMFVVIFSLIAFTVPALQVYVMIQQNDIIKNQNKYFNVQVYDTVAKSLASDDITAKQLTAGLLARGDFDLLNAMVSQVFSDDSDTFASLDSSTMRELLVKEAGARAYLLEALSGAIDIHGHEQSLDDLWVRLEPSLLAVARDAAFRVPLLLRFGASSERPTETLDTQRYLFNVGIFLRKVWGVASGAGETESYFASLAQPLAALARKAAGSENLYSSVFAASLQELYLDIGLDRRFGAKPVDLDSARIDELVAQGFKKLESGVGARAKVNWTRLRKLSKLD